MTDIICVNMFSVLLISESGVVRWENLKPFKCKRTNDLCFISFVLHKRRHKAFKFWGRGRERSCCSIYSKET